MNRQVVVDTSVIFKWFVACGESGISQSWDLLRQHRQNDIALVAPSLALAEVANLLSYAGLDAEDAAALLEDLEKTHISLFEMTPGRMQHALKCSFESRISVYDALFLALAQELDCPLVTADRRAFGGLPASVAEVRLVL